MSVLHLTEPVRGLIPHGTPIMFANVANNAEITKGSLVTLNTSGEWVAGSFTDDSFPFWIVSYSHDYDVSAESGGAGAYVNAFFPTGIELRTTEFVTGCSYVPGQTLLVASNDEPGKIQPRTDALKDKAIVGVVTKGITQYTVADVTADVLEFMPIYIQPKTLKGSLESVNQLPDTPETGRIYFLSQNDSNNNAPKGTYIYNGSGWICVSYSELYDLGTISGDVSQTYIPGVAYKAEVGGDITSWAVTLTSVGLVKIVLTNDGGYAVAQPTAAGRATKLLGSTAWDKAAEPNVQVLIEDDSTALIISAMDLV